MELTRATGNDPPLVGLMRVFKDYYPDVIVGAVTLGRASVFTVRSFISSHLPHVLSGLSTQTLNGATDSMKSRTFTSRELKTADPLSSENLR